MYHSDSLIFEHCLWYWGLHSHWPYTNLFSFTEDDTMVDPIQLTKDDDIAVVTFSLKIPAMSFEH